MAKIPEKRTLMDYDNYITLRDIKEKNPKIEKTYFTSVLTEGSHKLSNLILQYGEDSYIEISHDYSSSEIYISTKRDESDEEYFSRLESQYKVYKQCQENQKRRKENRDAKDYELFLKLKQKFEKEDMKEITVKPKKKVSK